MDSSRGRFDAIVFDVGGVLVAHENHLIYERLASRCDSQISARDVEAVIVDPRWDIGAAPISDVHARLCHAFGYAGDWAQFLTDWCCHFTLDHSMLALVDTLARTNRVILFSNTNRAHWEFLLAETEGALDTFERYLSYEMGVAKPDIRAFDMVAAAAKITASQSVFFDDRVENVEGARRAGFQAEVFAGEARLRSYLASAGTCLPEANDDAQRLNASSGISAK